MITFFKKYYKNIFIFIAIFIIIAPVIITKELNNLDEIWNYNFAKNIADGLIPYRDFNMVITPLLSMIAGLFLKIFGNELITMRILAILLNTFIFFMSYLLLKKLNVKSHLIYITLFLFFIILKNYICIDYNFCVLAFILLIIYLELIFLEKNSTTFQFKHHFIIGLLAGCCVLFKQTTGLFVSLACVCCPIIVYFQTKNNKIIIQSFLVRLLGIFIPILFLIIYLLFHNAFYDFINYTILGIKTFSNQIPYTNLIRSNQLFIKIASIGAPLLLIFSFFYSIIKKKTKMIILSIYAVASCIVIFPICDNIHFLIGIFPILLLFIYLLNNLLSTINLTFLNKKIKIFTTLFLEAILFLIFILQIIYSISHILQFIQNNNDNTFINHYYYIPTNQEQIKTIQAIGEYVKLNNAYILDANAALYKIPINYYTKDYDLFLKGNLGRDGEIGQIEKIKNLKPGTQLLIKTDEASMNWQTPKEVIHYIQNNLHKIGEFYFYSIYEI